LIAHKSTLKYKVKENFLFLQVFFQKIIPGPIGFNFEFLNFFLLL